MSKVTVEANDGPTHEVVIYDETAQALAGVFLPPEGSTVSGEELHEAVTRLVEATNLLKQLRSGAMQ